MVNTTLILVQMVYVRFKGTRHIFRETLDWGTYGKVKVDTNEDM